MPGEAFGPSGYLRLSYALGDDDLVEGVSRIAAARWGEPRRVAAVRATPPWPSSVRGLRKAYGGRPAVDGLDLDIHRGEVFALLGPNGAGKTTTVEILEGYRRRDAGEVSVLGHDPGTTSRVWRQRIGIVLQSTAESAELTVGEMVRHFALYYPSPRDPDEVIAGRRPAARSGRRGSRSLSGGQRRRLDVALGIVGRPELLFLDEPTTGFDPAGAPRRSGSSCGPCAATAPRSCSPRTTSTRPSSSPTGSGSSPPAACSRSTPPSGSAAASRTGPGSGGTTAAACTRRSRRRRRGS